MRDSDSGNQKKGQFRLKKYTATLIFMKKLLLSRSQEMHFSLLTYLFLH